ncbi:MAG: class I SAM-dependent methyltransferase, partial [Thermofilaceae archaeon]
LKSIRDLNSYVSWRIRNILNESGIDKELSKKPFHEFADVNLAKLVHDVMISAGYAEGIEERLNWLSQPGSEPTIETMFLAELKPAINKTLETLPDALRNGERPLLRADRQSDLMGVISQLWDPRKNRLFSENFVLWSGVYNLPKESVIVDALAKLGILTFQLLRLTECRVVAVDPSPVNIGIVEGFAEILGATERLEARLGNPEELDKIAGEADLIVSFNALPWVSSPLAMLRAMRQVSSAALVFQPTYDNLTGKLLNVIDYLLGSTLYPTASQLREMFKNTGWQVAKETVFAAYMAILEKSQQ